MNKGYIIILISSVAFHQTAAKDFSNKKASCSKLDSCYTEENHRTCSCSSQCHIYGTCCQDAEKSKSDLKNSTFVCYQRKITAPVFVKQSCADDYKGHVMTIKACFDNDIDEKDVQHNLLATSSKTSITYFNNHCAICNNDAKSLVLWDIEVFCPRKDKVNEDFIRNNLTYKEDMQQWGLFIEDKFLVCTVRYTPPSYFEEPDHCIPNLISSCPYDYSDQEVVAKCMDFYAERKHRYSNLYFRNDYCAICNGVDLRELECSSMMDYEEDIEDIDFQNMTKVVFTQGRWIQSNVRPLSRAFCSKNYLYDPIRARCRKYVYKIPIVKNLSVSLSSNLIYVLIILILLLF